MRRKTFAALALVPVLALGLPACGKESKNASGSPTAKAASDADKMRQFAKCMRENGINMPDPEVDSEGRIKMEMKGPAGNGKGKPGDADKTMEAAESKCRHLQPNGGKPRKLDAQQLAKMRAFAKCMRENGINMPDPDPDGGIKVERRNDGGGSGPNPEGPEGPDSPKFKAAQKACQKFEPGGAGKPGLSGSQG